MHPLNPLDLIVWGLAAATTVVVVAVGVGLAVVIVNGARQASTNAKQKQLLEWQRGQGYPKHDDLTQDERA